MQWRIFSISAIVYWEGGGPCVTDTLSTLPTLHNLHTAHTAHSANSAHRLRWPLCHLNQPVCNATKHSAILSPNHCTAICVTTTCLQCSAIFLICVLRSAATMHLITQLYTEQIKTWEAHRLINLKRRCCWTAIGGEGEDKEFRSSADFLEKIARKTNMTLQWSTDKYKNLRNNNWAQVDL